MNINSYFSLKRVMLLFRFYNSNLLKKNALVFLSVLGVFFVFFIVRARFGIYEMSHNLHFITILYAGGLTMASNAFKDVHLKKDNHTWFMMPASIYEKFFERFVVTSVMYCLGVLIVYYLFSCFSSFLINIFIEKESRLFRPDDPEVLNAILHYLILHTLFFCGGAWFKKYNFSKTFSIISLVGALYVLMFGFLLIWLTENNYLNKPVKITLSLEFIESLFQYDTGYFLNEIFEKIYYGSIFFYYWLLAPVCLSLSFYKLKNIEVKDGV